MRPLRSSARAKNVATLESYLLPGAILLLMVSALVFALTQADSKTLSETLPDIGKSFPDKELFTLTSVDFGPDYPSSNRNIDLQCEEFHARNITAHFMNGANVFAQTLTSGRAQLHSAEMHQLRSVAVDTGILKSKQAQIDTIKVASLLFGAQGHELAMKVFSMHPTYGVQFENFELSPSPFSESSSPSKQFAFGYALLDSYNAQVVLSRYFHSSSSSGSGSDDNLSAAQNRFVSDLMFFRRSDNDAFNAKVFGPSSGPFDRTDTSKQNEQNGSGPRATNRRCGPSAVLYGYGNDWYNFFEGCSECVELLVDLGVVSLSPRSVHHARSTTDSLVLRMLAARSNNVFLSVIGNGGNNRFESRQSNYNIQYPVSFPVFFLRDVKTECLLPIAL